MKRNNDRRSHRRYDIHLPVQYRVSQHSTMPIVGTATTCDLSTGGLSFRCRRILPVGSHIELSVEWPALCGDSQAMDLQVTGSWQTGPGWTQRSMPGIPYGPGTRLPRPLRERRSGRSRIRPGIGRFRWCGATSGMGVCLGRTARGNWGYRRKWRSKPLAI